MQMMKRITVFPLRYILICSLILLGRSSHTQVVSPVIAEYKGKAEGTIALTNNTLVDMAVVLEPRSFSIASDGNGVFRSLDRNIRLELSSMSFRINPGQTYHVSYRARAATPPAWFTIYATFSSLTARSGLDVQILLPHTVYIYPTRPKSKEEVVEVKQAAYFIETGKIVCEIVKQTADLERVVDIRIASESKSITSPGFPLLPVLSATWR